MGPGVLLAGPEVPLRCSRRLQLDRQEPHYTPLAGLLPRSCSELRLSKFGVKVYLTFEALSRSSCPPSGLTHLPLPPGPSAEGQSCLPLPHVPPAPATSLPPLPLLSLLQPLPWLFPPQARPGGFRLSASFRLTMDFAFSFLLDTLKTLSTKYSFKTESSV